MPKALWTTEQAKAFGAIGGQTTKLKAELKRKLKTANTSEQADDFQVRRLLRVRKQLNLLDDAIELELKDPRKADGQRVSWLATASQRLSDQEFAHSGRSKPGNLRPTTRGPVKSTMVVPGGQNAPPSAAPEPAPDPPVTPTPSPSDPGAQSPG